MSVAVSRVTAENARAAALWTEGIHFAQKVYWDAILKSLSGGINTKYQQMVLRSVMVHLPEIFEE